MEAMIKSQPKNELLLLSGEDIPFIEGSVTIHPPKIREIAYIGEDAFYSGCELLKFSKDILTTEDNLRLSQYSDFDILMSIMSDKSGSLMQNVSYAQMVLDLIFPLYTVICTPSGILCMITKDGQEEIVGGITSQNFDAFKQIIK